jgi:NitT/TauT family transport system substrate-binding protein
VIFKALKAILSVMCLVAAGDSIAADQVTFHLGYLPNGANAPIYVGVHEGLFAAEGLDVTIIPGRGATDTLTKIATGVADLGEVAFDVLLAAKAEGPVPVTAVMPYFTKPPDSLITTTLSGITTLRNVVGRSVATSPFSSSNFVWPVILKMNGIDPATVTFIKADPNTLSGMLATGRVDAIITWATTAPSSIPVLAAAGKTIKIIPWSDSGYEGYSQTLVAADRFIAKRPDVLRRLLNMTRRAIRIVNENPMRAAEIMKAMVPHADLDALKGQVEATQVFVFNEVMQRDGLGVFTQEGVRKSWEWVAKANGYPSGKIDPMTAVDRTFGS